MRKHYRARGYPTPYWFNRSSTPPKRRYPSEYLLDTFTLDQLESTKHYSDALCKYHWEFYSELALQRAAVADSISAAIISKSLSTFAFPHWQRTVKYVYSLSPLASIGSVKNGGGRFNIGNIDENRFPTFQALYIAEDKETALSEALGQSKSGVLNSTQLALTNPESITVLSVSGEVESVFDLTNSSSLTNLIHVISHFRASDRLWREARRLKLPPPETVGSADLLLESFLDPNWRAFPQVVDVPANSQIFGQLARSAGCGGVLYLSKMTGRKSLALFPDNFQESKSFVQLDDATPSPSVISRIDQSNWQLSQS